MSITFEEAVAAQEADDFATAERGYLAFPHSKNALYNLGTVYRKTGRWDEGAAVFRRILAQYPDFALARRALAICLLARRRYAEAWLLYEARREVQGTLDPKADYPEWRGEPLAGRRIVVVAEQGFGDQLMFARYLPVLEAQGAEVVLACDPRHLARLFERGGFATAPYLRAGQELPAADYWAFVCSLPLGLQLQAPGAPAYLETPAAGNGVGVVTRGNPDHENDRHRSLGGGEADALLRLGRDLAPSATGARDFLETADILAGLELVITVDSAVAHLAGAMGKPCWVLLPAIGADWRWNEGERSDWYPQARLFRQAAPGDWAGVLAEVSRALGRQAKG